MGNDQAIAVEGSFSETISRINHLCSKFDKLCEKNSSPIFLMKILPNEDNSRLYVEEYITRIDDALSQRLNKYQLIVILSLELHEKIKFKQRKNVHITYVDHYSSDGLTDADCCFKKWLFIISNYSYVDSADYADRIINCIFGHLRNPYDIDIAPHFDKIMIEIKNLLEIVSVKKGRLYSSDYLNEIDYFMKILPGFKESFENK